MTSNIQWTGETNNPWVGCLKKSPGCKYCYMYRDMSRFGRDPRTVVRTTKSTWNKPLKWNREVHAGTRKGANRLVFTCSWSDYFNPEADEWRQEHWEIIRLTDGLIWQILTKLPQRINDHLPPFWDEIKDRVWLMTSVENQEATWRIDALNEVDVPIKALSIEPLLEEIDLSKSPPVSWWIVGGESGYPVSKIVEGRPAPKFLARPFEVEWARSLKRQARDLGVNLFIKQMGSDYAYRHALRDKKGGDMSEWPDDIRIRDFPTYIHELNNGEIK